MGIGKLLRKLINPLTPHDLIVNFPQYSHDLFAG